MMSKLFDTEALKGKKLVPNDKLYVENRHDIRPIQKDNIQFPDDRTAEILAKMQKIGELIQSNEGVQISPEIDRQIKLIIQ